MRVTIMKVIIMRIPIMRVKIIIAPIIAVPIMRVSIMRVRIIRVALSRSMLTCIPKSSWKIKSLKKKEETTWTKLHVERQKYYVRRTQRRNFKWMKTKKY